MAIYYKDFSGKVRTVVAGKAPFPLADNSTVGGVKVIGGPGESAPYKVMSEGAVDGKLFNYAKKEHTHLIKDVYKLGESLDSKAPIDHIHDDRYYTEAEVDGKVNQISTRIDQVDDELAGKAPISHAHSDYLTKTLAGEVYQPKSAMALYATKEDLKKVGSTGYLYMLAASDTTASQACLDSLRKYERIEDIAKDDQAMTAVLNSSTAMTAVANSSTAMRAVINSSTAMAAVANSYTAMMAVANCYTAMMMVLNSSTAMTAVANSSAAMMGIVDSKKTKTLNTKTNVSGRLLPLFGSDYKVTAVNSVGASSAIGTSLGEWLRKNIDHPIAKEINIAEYRCSATYYDLDDVK